MGLRVQAQRVHHHVVHPHMAHALVEFVFHGLESGAWQKVLRLVLHPSGVQAMCRPLRSQQCDKALCYPPWLAGDLPVVLYGSVQRDKPLG